MNHQVAIGYDVFSHPKKTVSNRSTWDPTKVGSLWSGQSAHYKSHGYPTPIKSHYIYPLVN